MRLSKGFDNNAQHLFWTLKIFWVTKKLCVKNDLRSKIFIILKIDVKKKLVCPKNVGQNIL